MIVVIADDLSGAAEIAGIGLRYDLSVMLTTNFIASDQEADLLVIDTDTRSMSQNEAEIKIENLVQQLVNIKTTTALQKN